MDLWHIIFEYLEEFLKVFLLLFFIGGFKRKEEYNSAGVFSMGLIILCVIVGLTNSDSLSSTFIVGMVLATNFLLLERKTLFYLVIFSELLISFFDALIAGLICMAMGYSMDQALLNQRVRININGISLLILLLLSIYSRRKAENSKEEWFLKNKKINKYIILLILGIVASCFFIIPAQEYSLLQVGFPVYKKPLLGATISGLVFIIIIVIGVFTMYQKDQYKQKSKVYHAFIKQQSIYYEELIQREVETKRFRHDIDKHLNYIKICIDEGHEDKVSQYIGQLTNMAVELQGGFYTGNSAIDIIIRQTRMKEKDITLIWQGIFPEENRMEEADICGLFGNLLDNAVSAVEKCSNEKVIKINCKTLDKNIYLQVKNPLKEGVQIKFRKGLPVTTKSSLYHGFGVINIVSVVEKYGGNVLFSANEEFLVDIVLLNIST